MSQRDALATQGVKVRERYLTQRLSHHVLLTIWIITTLNPGDVFWEAPSKHNQLHERLLWRRTYPECFEQVSYCDVYHLDTSMVQTVRARELMIFAGELKLW